MAEEASRRKELTGIEVRSAGNSCAFEEVTKEDKLGFWQKKCRLVCRICMVIMSEPKVY